MPKTQLATFRLDADTWEEFQKFARRQGSTASALLLGFVDSCLAGDSYKSDDRHLIESMVADAVSDRTAWINSTLVEEIHLLQARLAVVEDRLNNLDGQDIQDKPSVDVVQATSLNNLDSQDIQDKPSVDVVQATSLNNLDSQDIQDMDRDEIIKRVNWLRNQIDKSEWNPKKARILVQQYPEIYKNKDMAIEKYFACDRT